MRLSLGTFPLECRPTGCAHMPSRALTTREQAWSILDSLQVDPGVKLDWSSAG